MIGSNIQIVACPPDERIKALETLYQTLPAGLRGELIVSVLDDARRGRVDLSGLWVARRTGWGGGDRVVGAILTQRLAGRAVALWPPEVRSRWNRGAIAARLVREVVEAHRAEGAAIVQAVLDESADPRNALDLVRGGMPRVTDLIFMRRDVAAPRPLPIRSGGPRLRWRGLDETGEEVFRRALGATYAGSLDMPELEGVRSLGDVMAGHRATGEFAPHLWRLGTLPERSDPAAVLILSPIPGREAWEVVYLGLVPEVRGLGLGAEIIAHARDLALADQRVSTLELAADARNQPALKLYQATGFIPHDRRSVHLVVFPPERAG